MEFEFKALDDKGGVLTETISADDRFEALRDLKARKLTILDLKLLDSPEAAESGNFFKVIQTSWVRVSDKDIMLFTRQLSDLMDAGIPVLETISSLRENVSSEHFARVLQNVESDIRKGVSFSAALANQPQVFDEIFVGMVRVGETSGRLPEVIAGLADYQERDQALRSQIKGALSYPLITLGFSLFLCWALVAHLLPGFAPIWQQSGVKLSDYPITLFLMRLSDLTKSYADETLLTLALVGLVVLYKFLISSSTGKMKKDSFLLHIPVIGSFVRMGVLARVANTMGTLSTSGINMVKTLEIAADTAGNEHIRAKLKEVSKRVQEGSSLTEAFRAADEFPKMMLQMIGIGEKSGNIDAMLPRLARYYDRQLQDSMKAMTSLLEPGTMILIGGVVFTFVLGVFLPIMGIVKGLQNQM